MWLCIDCIVLVFNFDCFLCLLCLFVGIIFVFVNLFLVIVCSGLLFIVNVFNRNVL